MKRRNRVEGYGGRMKRYGAIRRMFERLGIDDRPKQRIIKDASLLMSLDYRQRPMIVGFNRIRMPINVTVHPTPLPVMQRV